MKPFVITTDTLYYIYILCSLEADIAYVDNIMLNKFLNIKLYSGHYGSRDKLVALIQ